MDVVGRATQEAKAEDEGRCYAAGPHPGPLGKCSRQLLRALLYLLDGCSRRRSTSSIHGVVHPCSRLPQGEGEEDVH